MIQLIRKLIFKKLAVRYEFIDFGYANYFAKYFLSMLITPKHLKLAAGGGLIGGFFNNLLEGYRTPVPIKIHQTTQPTKPFNQGGLERYCYEKRKTDQGRTDTQNQGIINIYLYF